jgi:PQQ-like domain
MRTLRCVQLGRVGKLALLVVLGLSAGAPACARAQPEWTTYHRDPGRSGYDSEDAGPVTPSFAWQSVDLGAPIWSQPLVLGSTAYVATVGDELYALDASTGKIVWQKSAGTPVPSEELPCGDIQPTVGIVGTPVIDLARNEIYVVADTWEEATGKARHLLEGFSLSDGEKLLSVPVDPPGADPKALLQRTALNLDGERIIFGFGGNDGDCSDYRGAVVSAPQASTGEARWWQAPIALPSTSGGAVWAPSGPAVDAEGNVYATTGNPVPPEGEPAETFDYSDSVVELELDQDFAADPLGEPLTPAGWFEPPNWEEESNNDEDLSSAGAELLPGGLLFQAGKDGVGYLIDERTMGSGAPAVYSAQVCGGNGSFGGDAYANGIIYIACTTGVQALAYDEATRSFSALWRGPSDAFGPPIVAGGLVWVVATGGFSGGGTTLYALDPGDGATKFTETLPSPVADHFGSPSAAGGRLFVSTGSTVSAYALTPLASPTQPKSPGPSTGGSAAKGGSTGAASQATPSGVPSALRRQKGRASSIEVLEARLHLGGGGWLVLRLRCLARSKRCEGKIVVSASIRLAHRRRALDLPLARRSFHSSGKRTFAVPLELGRRALAHIARHRRSTVLHVRVLSRAGSAKSVSIKLS